LRRYHTIIKLFSLIFVFALYSCSVTRDVSKNEYLLTHTKVHITNPDKQVEPEELLNYIQQKPNKKVFGVIQLKLMMHNIKKKWGEPPQVLDMSLVKKSEEQIKKYLNKRGYYNSIVEGEIIKPKPKKARVVYNVTLSKPYRINKIEYDISDDSIKAIIEKTNNRSLVKPGDIFSIYKLDDERSRIAEELNENGYFFFTKDYVFYEVDTALGNRMADMKVIIKNILLNPDKPGQKPVEMKHKKYYVNNVYIYPDFNSISSDSLVYDTLQMTKVRKKTHKILHYNFLYHPPLKIKPGFLTNSIYLENNKKYDLRDARLTFQKLNELQIYKYVNINFNEVKPDTIFPGLEKNYLDCNIRLTRSPLHSYSIEGQGTNSGGDLGLGGYLTYKNKNLFRGGEVFTVRFRLALEARQLGVPKDEQKSYLYLFNTIEYGIDASLSIPKFLAPISQERFSRYFRPTTALNLGYNFQDQQEYRRIISNISFGYQWPGTQFTKHILYPVDMNLIKVNTTPQFDSILANESERVRNQYTNHLIFALKYSYILNTQELGKIKNFYYLRGNAEFAGNLLDGIMSMANVPKNEDGYRTLFGLRYSQYAKFDLDFRYYFVFSKDVSVAIRSYFGIAIPYGNSNDIPYEKGFYGGGANGLRAWPLRYLGPGSYSLEGANLERIGDIMIEENIEYRFTIYQVFKGAFFFDIGNIWLLKEDPTFPGGKFKFGSVLGQLASDAGIGFRFDFSYFVLRFDFAQRISDPALPAGDRFVIGRYKWFNPYMNLGIGYPF